MSTEKLFTQEEWELVSSTPQLLGSAVAAAGRSGIFGTMKEAMASIRTIMDGTKSFPNNELIKAIAPDVQDRTAARDKAIQQRDIVMKKLKDGNIKEPKGLQSLAIEEVKKSVELAKTKLPKEAVDEFKSWLLYIAQNVAEAAKEGSFLGFGGELVSAEEQNFLQELKDVLD